MHYFKKMLQEEDTTYLHHAASQLSKSVLRATRWTRSPIFTTLYGKDEEPDSRSDSIRTRPQSLLAEQDEEARNELAKIERLTISSAGALHNRGYPYPCEKYDEAIVSFTSITQTRAKNKIDQQVVELSFMALGRLYYDRDMLDEP